MPTGNAPVASVLQTEWFTCSIGHEIGQVRGTRTHPAGFTGLNAAGYIITWEKWILRPESHRHRLLYERSALLALPRRNETGAPARTCTSTLRLRTATCMTLTPRELKRLHHAGAAPAHAVWKTAMRAATSMTWKWWLNSELRRTLLGFSEALICLSYSALKWSLREVTLPGLSVIG